jgi:hypothetical protein
MATRSVKITVTLEDGVHGDRMGEASSVVNLREDLLIGAFVDAAQDWYSQMVSALGTMAYRDAFPRSGRVVEQAPGQHVYDVEAALDRLKGSRNLWPDAVKECPDCPNGEYPGSMSPDSDLPRTRCARHRGMLV